MRKLFKFLGGKGKAAVEADRDDGERRRNRRRPIDAPVLVRVGPSSHECRLQDVGPGGAFLRPRFDTEVGGRVTVVIPNTQITASADVIRVEESGVGVQFDEETLGAVVTAWSRGLFD